MRPEGLATKIFLDSGDPQETRDALALLGFLDGQTTNPSLVAKNPAAQERLAQGKKFRREEVYELYAGIVKEISALIPDGSVSVEVYADAATPEEEILSEGERMFSWIPNAHIKFPITRAGLAAAARAVESGMRVNMTLCFSGAQAAAVYAATLRHGSGQALQHGLGQVLQYGSGQVREATKGQVFISPFVGRLDDRGENGMDLIKSILKLYEKGDGHVEVLTASVRNVAHFLSAIHLGSDIITAPLKVLKEWSERGFPMPGSDFA
ncbi:MAG: transaldolase family protein, partial [Patescibacteria group bacterium]